MSRLGLIDLLGREVLPCVYHQLGVMMCGLMVCRPSSGDPSGYLDLNGKFVIPPKYDVAYPFDPVSGLATVQYTRGDADYYGLIDLRGDYVVEPVYQAIGVPSEGMIRFQSFDGDQLFGFLDRAGIIAIPPRYKQATNFSYGVAGVVYPGNIEESYFIDHSGANVLGPYPAYSGGGPVEFRSPGLAYVAGPGTDVGDPTGEWRYMARNGKILATKSSGEEPCYPPIGVGERRLGEKGIFGRVGLVQNETGRWLLPPMYDEISYMPNLPYIEVKLRNHEQLLDLSGQTISPSGAKNFGLYGCGRVPFQVETEAGDDKWGYLAVPSGDVVIPPKFSFASRFSEGFAVYRE